MEERVGAYIIDSEGNLIPDLNDAAMAARQNESETCPRPGSGIRNLSPTLIGDQKSVTEVNKDA